MAQRIYSAGLVSQSFWFVEFKKVIQLISEGKTEKEIKQLCIDENLFGAAKEERARRMYGYIWNRVKQLDEKMIDLFMTSDLLTQKLINFIAILMVDKLFFEFVYEVYREKHILGEEALVDADANIFFNNKETQSDEVLKFTDQTRKRLRSAYFNYMIDANLLAIVDKNRQITIPILDIALERYLIASGNEAMVKALTGVR